MFKKNCDERLHTLGHENAGPERLPGASQRSKLAGVGGARSKATLEKP